MARLCVLVAHPDDETMFFLPLILRLRERNRVSVYCVTNGNAAGLGRVREREMAQVASALGLSGVTVLNDCRFQDSTAAQWDEPLLATLIQAHLEERGIDKVYTFDQAGVSFHPNHCSLSRAASLLRGVPVLRLKTYPALWKYCVVSKWLSFRCSERYRLSLWESLRWGFGCMMCHRSQLVWFRVLYVLLSCYLCINEFN